MPNTYSALYTHLVFSTKHREPVLRAELRPRVFEYLGGIARNTGCTLIDAGGVEDHVHLLIRRHPSKSESDAMRDLKANSSRWLKEFVPAFGWQDGGGAFRVGPRHLDAVRRYFASQEEHHRTRTFREEFVAFLDRYGVEYDRKYVFD